MITRSRGAFRAIHAASHPAHLPAVRLRRNLGEQLKHTRQSRGISLAQASAHLLMSTRQLIDLEDNRGGAFHNDGFRLRAATAYSEWLGVTDIFDSADDDVPTEAFSALRTPFRYRPTMRMAALALSAVAVGIIGAAFLAHRAVVPPGPSTGQAVPVAHSAAPTPAPAAQAPPPAQGTATPPATATPLLLVQVDRSTWLFARFADGSVLEMAVEPDTPFELPSDPIYLAIGAEHGLLLQGSRVVRLDAWASKGVIRLNRTAVDEALQRLRT